MKQDIDPNAPGYDPAASFFPQQESRCYRLNSNVVEFKLVYKGNGKLREDFYAKEI